MAGKPDLTKMAFGVKTQKGQKAKQKLQDTYSKWWVGIEIKSKSTYNGIKAIGIVKEVEYLGDCFQGCVKLTLSNGCEAYVTGEGNRPAKGDINSI